MAGIGLYLPWDSQPQEVADVASGVALAYNAATLFDAKGATSSLAGSPSMAINALGRAVRIDTTGKSVSFTGRGPYFTGSFRLSFAFTVLGTVNNGGTIFRANATGGTNNNQIDIYTLTGGILRADFYGSTGFPSVATADTASGAIVAGGTYIVTIAYDRAANVSQWFVNGAPSGSASTTVARNSEASTVTVGGASAGAAGNIDLNFVGVESVQNGMPQDNLWGRFYTSRSIWVPVSAGGAATHDTTGALTGAGSTVAGSAAHIAIHGTSGALAGPGSSIAGASARTRAHPTSGALTGPGSAIAGTAAHVVPGGTHDTTGALTGPGASIAGTAAHIAKHSTSGALAGQGAAVSGTAARVAAAVTHDTSGVLTGPGAVISGQARGPDIVIADTHDGFWSREWYRLKKREEKKPTIAEVVEIVKESPQVLEVVRTEVQRKYPRVDYAAVRENVTLQRFIAKQLIEAAEEEDDIEAMLLMA